MLLCCAALYAVRARREMRCCCRVIERSVVDKNAAAALSFDDFELKEVEFERGLIS